MRDLTLRSVGAALAAFALLAPLTGVAAQGPEPFPRPPGAQGWIGISFAYDDAEGDTADIVVQNVFEGSPAEAAGLRPGDVLLAIDGRSVGPRELFRFAGTLRPGQEVRLRMLRDESVRELELVADRRPRIAEMPVPPELIEHLDSVREALRRRFDSLRMGMRQMEEAQVERLERVRAMEDLDTEVPRMPSPHLMGMSYIAGARMTSLNPGLSEYFGVERGVLVTEVLDESPAQEAGVSAGDVIVSVDGEAVSSLEELRRRLVRTARWPVTLEVVRRGEETTVRLRR